MKIIIKRIRVKIIKNHENAHATKKYILSPNDRMRQDTRMSSGVLIGESIKPSPDRPRVVIDSGVWGGRFCRPIRIVLSQRRQENNRARFRSCFRSFSISFVERALVSAVDNEIVNDKFSHATTTMTDGCNVALA